MACGVRVTFDDHVWRCVLDAGHEPADSHVCIATHYRGDAGRFELRWSGPRRLPEPESPE